jgi:hypothetical protein
MSLCFILAVAADVAAYQSLILMTIFGTQMGCLYSSLSLLMAIGERMQRRSISWVIHIERSYNSLMPNDQERFSGLI